MVLQGKSFQKRFGNIEILIEYFEIGELKKIQLLIEYLGSQIEPAKPPLRGGLLIVIGRYRFFSLKKHKTDETLHNKPYEHQNSAVAIILTEIFFSNMKVR